MDSTHRSNGFNRAPVCKFLLGSAIGSSVLLNFPLKHYQPYFIYSQADVFDRYQVWKVLTSKLAFLDLKDIFICSILIYYFKIFEKRLGSRKFCAKLLGTGLITTLLELLAVYLCRVWNIHIGPLPSGPLCLIYPLFVAFYCDIPRVPLSHIWGIPMTGKSLVYILGLQVASTSPESILTALCGILAGILWRLNFLKLRSLIRIPKFLSNLFQVTIGRLLDSSTPVEQNTKQMGATLASFGDQCTSDSECIDVNTECVKYRECTIGTCQCQTGYGSTNDNGCDKQLSLYNQECGGTTGKICKEKNQECSTTTGHCVCATWKTYHTTAQACVTVTYKLLTEQCGGWWQEECIVTEANGGCCDSSDSTCQCKDGYTMNLTESYTACRAPHYGEYCNTPPQCVVAFDTSTISIDTSNIAPTCLDNMCQCPGSHELKNVLGYNLCLNTVEADHLYKQNGENCTHFNDCTSSLCVRCPGSSTGICMADSSDGHTAQLTNGCLLSIATYILVSLGLF